MSRISNTVFAPLIDLVLYSNVWIALCAAAMCWQTQLLLSGTFKTTPLGAFIFFSTLLLYAVHRLVGLSKAEGFKDKGRYFIIERFRTHIGLYAVLSALATVWFAWQLSWAIWLWLLPGSLLSLGYVLPIFGRRLRDFHYLKIFLIAFSWAWITVFIPAVELGLLHNLPMGILFFERMFFIFAITLPFDIRDLEIDRANNVKTIPARLGLVKSKKLAFLALSAAGICAAISYRLDVYPLGALLGFFLCLLIAASLITKMHSKSHDYFFTGLVDGLMILQFLLVYLGYFS